jgi:hypothetical protein
MTFIFCCKSFATSCNKENGSQQEGRFLHPDAIGIIERWPIRCKNSARNGKMKILLMHSYAVYFRNVSTLEIPQSL